MKIVIYSANIGNYRRELSKIDKIKTDKNIDYYFFTDYPNLKSKHWNIINIKLRDELDFMNKYRHTAKYIKFIPPKIIRGYDIIIWIDSKSLKFLNFTYEKIMDYFKNRDKSIFFCKHRFNKSCIEELEKTMQIRWENKESGNKFYEIIKNIDFKEYIHPDTTCYMYRNIKQNKLLLYNLFITLLDNKLNRDQNVAQYVFYKFKLKVGTLHMKCIMR